ncbi:hypothetical protein Tco_0533217, partial [Tanacetum coccineum]
MVSCKAAGGVHGATSGSDSPRVQSQATSVSKDGVSSDSATGMQPCGSALPTGASNDGVASNVTRPQEGLNQSLNDIRADKRADMGCNIKGCENEVNLDNHHTKS